MDPLEHSPEISETRSSEALLLVVDSTTSCEQTFNRIRESAFRISRTRLIYSTGKNDLLGLIQAGSVKTENKLAVNEPGGYANIHVHMPLLPSSIRVPKTVQSLKHESQDCNFLNVLEVAGDLLYTAPEVKNRKNRLILFTSHNSPLIKSTTRKMDETELEDYISCYGIFRDLKIQVDIIIAFGKNDEQEKTKSLVFCKQFRDYDQVIADAYFEESEKRQDEEEQELFSLSALTCHDLAKDIKLSLLATLYACTNGHALSVGDALRFADQPDPKRTRAVSKFHGLLNIGNVVKIPVKRYSFVRENKGFGGKELSWEESKSQNRKISVIKETYRSASAKEDTILNCDDIIYAYPYGPQIIPINHHLEEEGDEGNNWGYSVDKGLDVIGFIKQSCISNHLFLSSTDVLLPLANCNESIKLFNCLAIALHIDSMGILIRCCTKNKGGAPTFSYVWPKLERSETKIDNIYLFIVQIPMKEDIRDLPFISLKDQIDDVQDETMDAMDQFISNSMLPNPENCSEDEEEESESEDDEDDDVTEGNVLHRLHVTKIPNPNLQWFNLCVLHRILNGVESCDFPKAPQWHSRLLKPSSYIKKGNVESREDAIRTLKTNLPIHQAQKRMKKSNRVHTTVSGEIASIGDFLPDETEEVQEEEEEERDAEGTQQNYIESNNEATNNQEEATATEEVVEDDIIANDSEDDLNDASDEVGSKEHYKNIQEGGGDGDEDEEANFERRLSSFYNSVEYRNVQEAEREENENEQRRRNSDSVEMSEVTEMEQLSDIRMESPVEDFQLFVKQGRFRYGVKCLETVLKRIIREGNSEAHKVNGVRCLKLFRKACLEEKEPKLFNDFVGSLVSRCDRNDIIGKKTTQFLEFVGNYLNGDRNSLEKHVGVIAVLRIDKNKREGGRTPSKRDLQYNTFLKSISDRIAELTSSRQKQSQSEGLSTYSNIESTK